MSSQSVAVCPAATDQLSRPCSVEALDEGQQFDAQTDLKENSIRI